MKQIDGRPVLSASDLSNHLACSHSTHLDFGVANGSHEASGWKSPDQWVLQERGRRHEEAYVQFLRASGLAVEDLRVTAANTASAEATRTAMRSGVDVIVQGTFLLGQWYGRADVLRRVESPSALGRWSYEVYDCKLSTDTQAGTILQLELYSEMVGAIQGALPVNMYVVPPGQEFTPEKYRVLDYAAYYRSVKTSLETAVSLDLGAAPTYPEPVEQCGVCGWFSHCDAHRRRDDHLSLVAGVNKLHHKQLKIWGIKEVRELALLPLPLEDRPKHSSRTSLTRVREQARIQVSGRDQGAPVFEILEMNREHGFCGLPEPSAGDIFFDLEGDPFIGTAGREYLFGFMCQGEDGMPAYSARWCLTAHEEQLAFEWFVDEAMKRWACHPNLHIYHFTAYEPSSLKRLMGRYATRENEIDRMLRAGIFVDLHTVVNRSLRASVETYSLKALEAFHGYTRQVQLETARSAMRSVQHALELEHLDLVDSTARGVVEAYNADDCLSTASLRIWLERQRQAAIEKGASIGRPKPQNGDAPEGVEASQGRVEQLKRDLVKGLPDDPASDTVEEAATRLLAALLDWHRREGKVSYWEFFRLRDLTDDELLDEKAALSGLTLVERLSVKRGVPLDRYAFDPQETEVREGDTLCHRGERIGEVVAINLPSRVLDIKKTKKTAEVHPTSIYVDCTPVNSQVLAEAIVRLAECVIFDGIDAPGPLQASRDLLLRRPPTVADNGGQLRRKEETALDAALRIGCTLQESVLPIQGPPGAGKTFTGARMILELVRQGKRVGVTANSHAVVRNLLAAVTKAAIAAQYYGVKLAQRVPEHPDIAISGIETITDNAKARSALATSCHVLGGTAWLWASKDFKSSVDVLFVDEAGQMALANVLAAAQAAKSVVLLGDPQQLDQPLKGTHPEGAGASALEHLLAGRNTIAEDRGLFLEETWRLHPKLCAFTSEVFYEGRLHSHPGLERQRLTGHPWLDEAGFWYVPIEHEGNRSTSLEEVERVATLVKELLGTGTMWDDGPTTKRNLVLEDILVVAPYNAQVAELAAHLPAGARVGTVDKFQGQEAPIVIYCLTTSSQEDAPRGWEFLYSLNRLNVATSRAQAVVIVIGSPRLLSPDCRSPRQMQLANALCRYVELARVRAT